MRIWLKIARLGAFAAGFGIALLSSAAPAFATSMPSNAALEKSFKASAKIVSASRPLQCVPYARKISGIPIRGDAWTWWRSAKGRFDRGQEPRVGAVLVMKKTDRLRLGHLAVVRRIVDERTIVVDQANWLNRGRIHLNTAVLDVSPKNDWSAVRVWYTPGGRFGSGTYAAQGFIYAGKPGVRMAGLKPVPMPRRRPAFQGVLDAVPAPVSPVSYSVRESGGDFVGTGRADPRVQPSNPTPRRTRYENLSRDTWYEDSRRG